MLVTNLLHRRIAFSLLGDRYEGQICAVFVDDGELCASIIDQYNQIKTIELEDPTVKVVFEKNNQNGDYNNHHNKHNKK